MEAAHEGDANKAANLAAGATALRAETGVPRSSRDEVTFDSVERLVNDALAPTARAAAEHIGRDLPRERLLTHALGGHGPRKRSRQGWLGLTAAERAVVELVAEHLTNVEIGHRLFMAPGTVKTHLAHAFDKLGLRSRREVAHAYNSRNSTLGVGAPNR